MSKSPLLRRAMLVAMVLLISGQACTLSLFQFPTPESPTQPPIVGGPSPTPQPMAQTTFVATLPEPLQPGETLALAILDEVTGLSFNATYYPMTARDALTYTAVLPLSLNSVVKYRYVRRSSAQVLEDSTLGTPVRYRLYHVVAQGEVYDIVADWTDKNYARPKGTLQGRVFNVDTGTPLPSMLVSAGGMQYLTDSAGRFDISGLPVGTHNLVVYSLDGMYLPFQQGATVADGLTTNVDLRVKPTPLVNITFLVAVPANTVPGAPVRVAGNLLQLGNTFADLQGGLSTSADRMPIMSLQPDGRYSTTVSLPVGTHIHYKYTLGDGLWNAEHKAGSEWMLREFIVPPNDLILEDAVETWEAGASSPILFEVTVPATTPPGDIISIQFNPYGWTEPIPMWPLGNFRWAYKLYSPLNMLGSFGYRYCRNGQCGSADDGATAGNSSAGEQIETSLAAQDIKDTVASWMWFEEIEPTTLVGANIVARQSGFMTGVEFQSTFRPNWSYYVPQALANAQALGSSHVVLTPSWTYTSINPLTFTTVPGQDPLWIDSAIMISQAKALGLRVVLFPTPHFPPSQDGLTTVSSSLWQNAPRDAAWWQTWFTRYRAFAINYADLATQTGAEVLVLGGDWVTPALPGGTMPDGSSPNAPADVEMQWKGIIAEVRQHFAGKVYWALPYTKSNMQTPLNFLQDTDGIYLLWNASLSTNPSATKADYATEAGNLLDNEVSALPSLLHKPIILAIAYPSAAGAASGCLADGRGGCLDLTALDRPNSDIQSISVNLQTQAEIYEAIFAAVNARDWINGVVSRGYYAPAALRDKSTSVHGKPAADILWYWYPRMLGIVK
ncbi:MAG: carboxypeptidase regulatory-like domain-containing protein [Chloroflexota bacterium]